MPVVAVGKPLREKLGDDGADSLVQFINAALAEQKNDILTFVEEKFERRLSETIGELKTELKTEIAETKAELKTEIAETKVELITLISQLKAELMTEIANNRTEIANTRSELIKWMFIFWVGQLGMIIGILFAFFK